MIIKLLFKFECFRPYHLFSAFFFLAFRVIFDGKLTWPNQYDRMNMTKIWWRWPKKFTPTNIYMVNMTQKYIMTTANLKVYIFFGHVQWLTFIFFWKKNTNLKRRGNPKLLIWNQKMVGDLMDGCKQNLFKWLLFANQIPFIVFVCVFCDSPPASEACREVAN